MKKLLYTHIFALVLLTNTSYAAKDTPINLTNINDDLKENDQFTIDKNKIIHFSDYDVPNFMLYPTITLDNSEPPIKKRKLQEEASYNEIIFNVKKNTPYKANPALTIKKKEAMMKDIITYVLDNIINYTTNCIIDEITTKVSLKEKEDMDRLISDASEYIKENMKNNTENESIQIIYDAISKKIEESYDIELSTYKTIQINIWNSIATDIQKNYALTRGERSFGALNIMFQRLMKSNPNLNGNHRNILKELRKAFDDFDKTNKLKKEKRKSTVKRKHSEHRDYNSKLSYEAKKEMITKICDYTENRLKTIDNIDQLEEELNNIALDIQKNTTLTRGKRSFSILYNFFHQHLKLIQNTNDPQKEIIKALKNTFARLKYNESNVLTQTLAEQTT
ncbi:MAG: hypothetical protein Q8S31_09295 [Alphaproteobacteria bacterium]|nr:hypothetical protein [Alphaproteobacteria bacterium]